MLEEQLPDYEVKRNYQYRGADDGADVAILREDGPSIWIECKKGKRTNIKAAMRQAIDDSNEEWIPIAVTRDDRQPIHVTMHWDTFVEFVQAYLKTA